MAEDHCINVTPMSPVPIMCVKPSFQTLTPASLGLTHSTHQRAVETPCSSKGQCKDVIIVEATDEWDQAVSPVSSNGCHDSLDLRQDDQSSQRPTFTTNDYEKSHNLTRSQKAEKALDLPLLAYVLRYKIHWARRAQCLSLGSSI